MKVKLLVRRHLPKVDVSASREDLRTALGYNSVVVVTNAGEYRGLLTKNDLNANTVDPTFSHRSHTLTIDVEEEIGQALETMRSTDMSVLPVFEAGRFAGVVHETDITDALLQYRTALEREVERYTNELSAANANLQLKIEERRRTETALRESERRYRELADLVPQPVFETNKEGVFTFANKAAFELFGYCPEDLNRGVNIAACVIPEDRQRARLALQTRIKGAEHDIQYTALS
ncbi:MAG: PAS domain S-box protein, partial [Chitinivibrionales bacterium]|nr:PAS domain S-box protein [Chitinivibrionales bacterium]MBD3358206.1 PAS domain S-box protein [Chitinivibrionales bacterium]